MKIDKKFSEFERDMGTALPAGSVEGITNLSRADADHVIQFIIKKDGNMVVNVPKGLPPDFQESRQSLMRTLMQLRNSMGKDVHVNLDLFPKGSPIRNIEYACIEEIEKATIAYSIEIHFNTQKDETAIAMPFGAISRLIFKDLTDCIHEIPKLNDKYKKYVSRL